MDRSANANLNLGDEPRSTGVASSQGIRPIYLLVTFWGDQYRRWFCDYALASLLAPGNIPALRRGIDKFLIATSKADWEALKSEPTFKLLETFIEPVFVENTIIDTDAHKYHKMSQGHKLIASICFLEKAYGVFISCDSIFPADTISTLIRLASEGKRIVLCTAVRFDLDGITNDLRAAGKLIPDQPIVLTKRDCVAVGLKNLHSETLACDWAAKNFGDLSALQGRNNFLTSCFWRVGVEGVVIVTHNWAPMLVDFGMLSAHDTVALDSGLAIDGDYIFRNFGSDAPAEVITDSDVLFVLGMTPRNEMIPERPEYWWKRNPWVSAISKRCILNHTYFDRHIDPFRRKIYPTLVRWHIAEPSASWRPVEAKVSRILSKHLKLDYSQLFPFGRPLRFGFWYWFIYTFISFDQQIAGFRLAVRSLIPNWVRIAASYITCVAQAMTGNQVEIERIRRRINRLMQ